MTKNHRYLKPLTVAATAASWLCAHAVLAIDTGLDSTAKTAGLKTGNTDLNAMIGDIINVVLGLVGTIFFVLMIYSGFLWMTAAGNQEQVKKAKSMMVNAVIGLIIVFASYAITAFVLTSALSGIYSE